MKKCTCIINANIAKGKSTLIFGISVGTAGNLSPGS